MKTQNNCSATTPLNGMQVLIYSTSIGFTLGYYDSGRWIVWNGDFAEIPDPLYWWDMPKGFEIQ